MAELPEDTTPGAAPSSPLGGNGGDPAAGQGEQSGPPLVIVNQYIKDLSFEAPSTPAIFSQVAREQPAISVNVNVQSRPTVEPQYEVVLHLRAECKIGDATAFLAELDYAGLFNLQVPPELSRPVLLIECPRLLFPFARHILANTTRDGGFMPLMLGPVDFVQLYQRQAQARGEPGLESLNLGQGPVTA